MLQNVFTFLRFKIILTSPLSKLIKKNMALLPSKSVQWDSFYPESLMCTQAHERHWLAAFIRFILFKKDTYVDLYNKDETAY